MNKVVIEDSYHMTTMDEDVKLTYLLSIFCLNLRAPICTSTFKFLNNFLNIHKEQQHLSLMHTMYTNASNNTPFYTHISWTYMVWRVHPWEYSGTIPLELCNSDLQLRLQRTLCVWTWKKGPCNCHWRWTQTTTTNNHLSNYTKHLIWRGSYYSSWRDTNSLEIIGLQLKRV